MRDIRRPDDFEPTVERMTNSKNSEVESSVFPTIMDFLVFCAGVGLSAGQRRQVSSTGKAVPYRIFENNQKEGYIFLVALADSKDPNILLGTEDDQIVKAFEEYAAGGLDIVTGWLSASPMDISGVQTLLRHIQESLPSVAPPNSGDLDPI